MLEILKSTLAGFRDQSEPVEMTESHLFRCDSCKTVYIDTKNNRVHSVGLPSNESRPTVASRNPPNRLTERGPSEQDDDSEASTSKYAENKPELDF